MFNSMQVNIGLPTGDSRATVKWAGTVSQLATKITGMKNIPSTNTMVFSKRPFETFETLGAAGVL